GDGRGPPALAHHALPVGRTRGPELSQRASQGRQGLLRTTRGDRLTDAALTGLARVLAVAVLHRPYGVEVGGAVGVGLERTHVHLDDGVDAPSRPPRE